MPSYRFIYIFSQQWWSAFLKGHLRPKMHWELHWLLVLLIFTRYEFVFLCLFFFFSLLHQYYCLICQVVFWKQSIKPSAWLQDVHDRALFYYRILQYNVSVAERVVNPPKLAVSVFADTQSSEVKDRIFDEFNSLSVVYQKVTTSLFQLYVIGHFSVL